ncbi:stage II sporulation protein M [Polluticoccus soli]|uniref:stage II sporulation protein M n=1 Tax=Polluticoccus soli TaxID=3034150 RepID=UPI0023E2CBCF|nr:stage II sporulation protein M [Flavipsychrobacter sp. JY13-12]
MREGQFIKRNIDRWKNYEEPSQDPDEIAKRFTYLVDDLSYAKTFYPFSNTVKYINGLAAHIYLSIYKNKKEKRSRFLGFWTTELPLIVAKHHKTLLYTFAFFIAFVSIGVFSSAHDQSFVRAILGDSYVDMTEQNIAAGDPFGVYKKQNELSMFLRIAFNNISVAFYCFAMGIFAGVGTLYVLFQNGLMLGVFEHLFFKHGLGIQSLLVVFIHGTLEISAIVIAGSAGMIIGNAILFPKTFTRLQSLTRAARDAVKIVAALVPIFVIAAFFEGFVTRHTNMPAWLSVAILALSLLFILWYFVFYPKKLSRRARL